MSFDFLILDEVASMRNFWVGWNEVLSPTLIDRKGSAMFISTPKGFNHFYKLWKEAEDGTNGYYPVRLTWDLTPGRDQYWKEDQIKGLGFGSTLINILSNFISTIF